MNSYVRWKDIRAEQVERAGGEEAVDASINFSRGQLVRRFTALLCGADRQPRIVIPHQVHEKRKRDDGILRLRRPFVPVFFFGRKLKERLRRGHFKPSKVALRITQAYPHAVDHVDN
jgi:hypothetical protein